MSSRRAEQTKRSKPVEKMQEWRNWQTRRLQVPVVARSCGFKSHFLHSFLFYPKSKGAVASRRNISSGRQQLFYFFHFSSTKYQEKSKTRVLSHFRYDVVSSKNNTFPKQKEDPDHEAINLQTPITRLTSFIFTTGGKNNDN